MYNTFMLLLRGVCKTKPKPNKVERVNTMSATITLNNNRARAAIFAAHQAVKNKGKVTEEMIMKGAERHMITMRPGPAVVKVIEKEVNRLLAMSKGKVTALPAIEAPLVRDKVTPVPVKGKADKPAAKGKKEAAAKAGAKVDAKKVAAKKVSKRKLDV